MSSRAGHVNVTLALSTTRYLRNDTEFVPWEVAIRNFNYFLLMFDRSEVYGPMQVSHQPGMASTSQKSLIRHD